MGEMVLVTTGAGAIAFTTVEGALNTGPATWAGLKKGVATGPANWGTAARTKGEANWGAANWGAANWGAANWGATATGAWLTTVRTMGAATGAATGAGLKKAEATGAA